MDQTYSQYAVPQPVHAPICARDAPFAPAYSAIALALAWEPWHTTYQGCG